MFIKWIHHLFNPHCEQCEMEREVKYTHIKENQQCQSCDTLRQQLEIANYEKKELLHKLLNPITETRIGPIETPQPIIQKHIPWRVKQQMLEEEDRNKARALKEAAKPVQSIESLEEELEVKNGKG